MIPTLFRSAFGLSLDEIGISLVNMSSTVFSNLAAIFDDERVRRRCAIITDGDVSIVKLPKDESTDSKFVRACRNSQAAGLLRRKKLDKLVRNNRWLDAFYSRHTFEVDFLRRGNRSIFTKSIPQVFTDKNRIRESEKRLADSDIAVCGKEALHLANTAGKGWFALHLAEGVSPNTRIPKYILQAIAFAAKDTITDQALKQMGVYRLEKTRRVMHAAKKATSSLDEMKTLPETDFVDMYQCSFVDDDLTIILEFLNAG